VLSSVVASQAELHADFGGVVPEIASRRHLELIDAVVDQAVAEAGGVQIEAIATTRGPGLVGALLVGLANAKARAWAQELPLVCVDHLAGHVASVLLDEPDIQLPLTCLLASGGHTMLLDVGPELELTLLGTTRDDAAGEAFDKGARLLGLDQPGGPAIQAAAEGGDPFAVAFTPAMVHHDSLDTSFSGLKTALAVHLRDHAGEAPLADVAASYQRAIVDTLAGCVRKALRTREITTFALVGGVAANADLRAKLEQMCVEHDVKLVAAPLRYCADNAAMIGAAASYFPALQQEFAHTVDAYATSPLFRSGRLVPTLPV
jgi:N6-L-threonylcarbamoyladenine synthase